MATSKTIKFDRLAALRGMVESSRQSLTHALCLLDHVAKCCEHEGAEGDLPSLVDAGRRLGYATFSYGRQVYATEQELLAQIRRSRLQLRELLAVVSAADAIRDPQRKWMVFLGDVVQDITAAIERLGEEQMLTWKDRLATAQAA